DNGEPDACRDLLHGPVTTVSRASFSLDTLSTLSDHVLRSVI
ncbi:MAG: hypothetical protein ACI915_004559, partial [Gammaproteobacteria bacterium]